MNTVSMRSHEQIRVGEPSLKVTPFSFDLAEASGVRIYLVSPSSGQYCIRRLT